jgi:hypothetical protein
MVAVRAFPRGCSRCFTYARRSRPTSCLSFSARAGSLPSAFTSSFLQPSQKKCVLRMQFLNYAANTRADLRWKRHGPQLEDRQDQCRRRARACGRSDRTLARRCRLHRGYHSRRTYRRTCALRKLECSGTGTGLGLCLLARDSPCCHEMSTLLGCESPGLGGVGNACRAARETGKGYSITAPLALKLESAAHTDALHRRMFTVRYVTAVGDLRR